MAIQPAASIIPQISCKPTPGLMCLLTEFLENVNDRFFPQGVDNEKRSIIECLRMDVEFGRSEISITIAQDPEEFKALGIDTKSKLDAQKQVAELRKAYVQAISEAMQQAGAMPFATVSGGVDFSDTLQFKSDEFFKAAEILKAQMEHSHTKAVLGNKNGTPGLSL